MENTTFTPHEGIDLITRHISNYKINYKENAQYFLLWGWILLASSISNFFILKHLHSIKAYNLMGPYSLGNWGIFLLIGFIILFFIKRNMKASKKVYSYIDSYVNKLWTVAASSFFVGTVICIKLNIAPPPVMLLIAAIATTTTGLLIKFKPVTLGGIVFFISSIIATFVNNEYLALLVGASILFGYIIPGYYLKSAKE